MATQTVIRKNTYNVIQQTRYGVQQKLDNDLSDIYTRTAVKKIIYMFGAKLNENLNDEAEIVRKIKAKLMNFLMDYLGQAIDNSIEIKNDTADFKIEGNKIMLNHVDIDFDVAEIVGELAMILTEEHLD